MCSKAMVAVLLALAVPASTGCSIKEDRTACPCVLSMDLGELTAGYLYSINAVDVLYECAERKCIKSGDLPLEMTCEVKKGRLPVAFHCLGRGWKVSGTLDSLIIPVGAQCPPIYSCHDSLDAGCEELRYEVHLHKNYAVIGIRADEFASGGYHFRLVGDVCGYSIAGIPLQGPYSYDFIPGAGGREYISVPRQAGDGMRLEVWQEDRIFRSFMLGKYINGSGYDWDAEDLSDIDVEVSMVSTVINLSSGLWDSTHWFPVLL